VVRASTILADSPIEVLGPEGEKPGVTPRPA
jgi:hypothetical protein